MRRGHGFRVLSETEVVLFAGPGDLLKHRTLEHYFKKNSVETINSSPGEKSPERNDLKVTAAAKAAAPGGSAGKWTEVASGSSGGAIFAKKDSLESVPTP